MLMKLAIVGGPGTGKTTLCYDVASYLKHRNGVAQLAIEYARRWKAKHGRWPNCIGDQAFIMRGQEDMENDYTPTQDILITDSSTWLCAVYASRYTQDRSDMYHLMDLTEKALKLYPSYDYTFVAPRVFKLQSEPGRQQSDEAAARDIDERIRGFISLFNLSVVWLPEDHKKWIDVITDTIGFKDAIKPAA
jgi:nicotinamide riboside kinase